MKINLLPQKTVKANDCKPGFLYRRINGHEPYSVVTACNVVAQATREYKESFINSIHFVVFTSHSIQGALVNPSEDMIEIGKIVLSAQQ